MFSSELRDGLGLLQELLHEAGFAGGSVRRIHNCRLPDPRRPCCAVLGVQYRLLITTGNFTKDAVREATRDGAPAIDLIDGDQLIDKLKELGLGVQSKKIEVEQITIEREWFASL